MSLAPPPRPATGVCAALGVSRASVYPAAHPVDRATPIRQHAVEASPCADRCAATGGVGFASRAAFADQAPAEIYATLLDDGVYIARSARCIGCWASMAKFANGVGSCVIPSTRNPVLAEKPNEVWSWDITKLMGPTKWSYFYSRDPGYIFSRRWSAGASRMLKAPRCSAAEDAIAKHNVPRGQLTLHADRGGPMKAKQPRFCWPILASPVRTAGLTSNNNPFSGSHFKTLKYQPRFPQRFGSIEHARTYRRFFD